MAYKYYNTTLDTVLKNTGAVKVFIKNDNIHLTYHTGEEKILSSRDFTKLFNDNGIINWGIQNPRPFYSCLKYDLDKMQPTIVTPTEKFDYDDTAVGTIKWNLTVNKVELINTDVVLTFHSIADANNFSKECKNSRINNLTASIDFHDFAAYFKSKGIENFGRANPVPFVNKLKSELGITTSTTTNTNAQSTNSQSATPILFYDTGKNFDIFSNVTRIPFQFNVGNATYNVVSSECIYQAGKDIASSEGKNILMSNSPNVQNAGKSLKNYNKAYDNQFPLNNKFLGGYYNNGDYFAKEELMRQVLLAKFTQNPAILKALLDTAGREIIENTKAQTAYVDAFWGNATDPKTGLAGRNALGKLLMSVRDELQAELSQTGKIQVRTCFDQNLVNFLGANYQGQSITNRAISSAELNKVQAVTITSNLGPSASVFSPSSSASTGYQR